MKAAFSPSLGVAVVLTDKHLWPYDGNAVWLHSLAPLDEYEVRYHATLAQDWEEISDEDTATLVERARRDVRRHESWSRIVHALCGVPPEIAADILSLLEDYLRETGDNAHLLNDLLVAPIADLPTLSALVIQAASDGLAASVALLERVQNLQPLLSRFCSLWLNLDPGLFESTGAPPSATWARLRGEAMISDLLEAPSRLQFMRCWNKIVLSSAHPAERICYSAIGEALASGLYPDAKPMVIDTESDDFQGRDYGSWADVQDHRSAGKKRDRALREVHAITRLVWSGKDDKAKRYLKDLLERQVSTPSGIPHAVKSLCNVAKLCADMFRSDFEGYCLNLAMSHIPDDGWMLVQYGDHLKRTGDYEGAISMLERAERFGQADVVKSGIADVYTCMGDYEKAIKLYMDISDWETTPLIQNAIADNTRRLGRFEEAIHLYDQLIAWVVETEGSNSETVARAMAGKAEVAKRQNLLGDALSTYEIILTNFDLAERSRLTYKMATGHILKQMGEYDRAFEIADQVVTEAPFSMHARCMRGSLHSLLERSSEGLRDLRFEGVAFGEWIGLFCRGLVLMRLERYADARKTLIDNLSTALMLGEDRDITRLGAAAWHLSQKQFPEASRVLSEVTGMENVFASYVLDLMRHHAAAGSGQSKLEAIESSPRIGQGIETISRAWQALVSGDYEVATQYEIEALLALAI